MHGTFGSTLRYWRSVRRMSQLDLGLTANVSARHISFLETGRASPSRAMVMQLCETLNVPRPERNTLLTAAGFASAYANRTPADAELEPVRSAIDWMLTRHDPYPAFAIDRHWKLEKLNKSASILLGAVGLEQGTSLLDFLCDRRRMMDVLENWQEVARHMLTRLRTENTHLGGDEVLNSAIERMNRICIAEPNGGSTMLSAVIPAIYKAGGQRLCFFSTIAQFGSAEDIALAELRIEMLFPADDATKEALLAMQATSS